MKRERSREGKGGERRGGVGVLISGDCSFPARRAHRIFEWGGHDPQGVPPMLVGPQPKKRLRSSIHPGRSQSQDGPSQA